MASPTTTEMPLYVTGATDPTVPDLTARCRACGRIVKKRGYAGHARSHLGARFVIDGTAYRVRELLDQPRNHYFLRPEKSDVPPADATPQPARPTPKYPWRQILDRLDAELHASGALAESDVFEARRALGRAIGCFVESAELGQRVRVSARTFPPMNENGAMQAPAAPLASSPSADMDDSLCECGHSEGEHGMGLKAKNPDTSHRTGKCGHRDARQVGSLCRCNGFRLNEDSNEPQSRVRLQFDRAAMRERIAADPDVDTEAGVLLSVIEGGHLCPDCGKEMALAKPDTGLYLCGNIDCPPDVRAQADAPGFSPDWLCT